MKKLSLILLSLLLTIPAIANEKPPKYLEDAVITVTLKSGKQYSYSANEYMVVKRGAKKVEIARAPETEKPERIVFEGQKRLKHIVSGELVNSHSGELDTSKSSSEIGVKNKRQMGVGLQYQYNIHKDVYMGGRLDTNGGAGLSLGLGF
jgi:hypothetical protein